MFRVADNEDILGSKLANQVTKHSFHMGYLPVPTLYCTGRLPVQYGTVFCSNRFTSGKQSFGTVERQQTYGMTRG
jgi:hypothetical protein